jgi:hypothetical protein
VLRVRIDGEYVPGRRWTDNLQSGQKLPYFTWPARGNFPWTKKASKGRDLFYDRLVGRPLAPPFEAALRFFRGYDGPG